MSTHDVLISIKDVSLSYNVRSGMFAWSKFTPLNNISFDLRRGETTGIIGRNGVGKSTLLRLIAGIIEPNSGSIVNYGASVSLLALGVGFVPHLSGRQNAMLSGMLLGLRKKEIEERIDAIVEFSGLGKFIDQPLHTYSSGMRARLGFSVSIQVAPDVLLIDEVLGVGDQEFRAKSAIEIKRVIRSDRTVVLVSHNLVTVKELCDNVVWIENGVVEEIGNSEKVLKHYADKAR